MHDNELYDNTDVDLILASDPGCNVYNNTIFHQGRYGFAGLMIAWGGSGGSSVHDNTVSSSFNNLSFGIMIGFHPWNASITLSNVGTVTNNTSSGSVVPLATDGIGNGNITGNNAFGNQGDRGWNGCPLSDAYTADHFGAATIQGGYIVRNYDNGSCNP